MRYLSIASHSAASIGGGWWRVKTKTIAIAQNKNCVFFYQPTGDRELGAGGRQLQGYLTFLHADAFVPRRPCGSNQ